jgi:lysylphosphatidylglycerol synthetase-like protein (DUF2156 family)
MSTGNPPIAPLAASLNVPLAAEEIRIVSHCTLFYWWPVWAFGFIMALLTFMTNQRMVLVDRGATFEKRANVSVEGEPTLKDRGVWVLSEKTKIPHNEMVRISPNKNLGVLFSIVLLIVIAITNIPLRGMWSVIVLVMIVSLSIIFALLDWWDAILTALQILDIRINFEGYMLISTVLFVLWVIVFFFFDNQIYMVFTSNQFRVRQEIGDGETAYQNTGIQIQKQRSDLFRHWILGFGSGDLIVNTAGAQAHHFEMPNVLFIGRKVNQIEKLLGSRTGKD